MQPLDLEIRSQLAKYLAGQSSLSAFQEWFVPRAWNIEKRADPAAVELVHEIDLRLAEFSNGDWTEEELRSKLRPLAMHYTVHTSAAPRTESSSAIRQIQVVYPGSRVDIRPVEVSSS